MVFIVQSLPSIYSEVRKHIAAYDVYISYHSECLGIVGCRQPQADSVDTASWTALWERTILGQQVKEGTTLEHLRRSEYTASQ